jgi:hypothetical protein
VVVSRAAHTGGLARDRAGGPAAVFGAIVPPWYGQKSLAVTMPVAEVVPFGRMTMSLRVLDQRLTAEGEALELAPAVSSLNGAGRRIASITRKSDERFLRFPRRDPLGSKMAYASSSAAQTDASRPAPKELIAQMSGADAIISAIGD